MKRTFSDPTPEGRIAAGKQRVLDRIIQREPDECWGYDGGVVAHGYGSLNVRLGGRDDPKVMLLAHRVAYEHWIGPIPEGTELDHTCKNITCPNPYHLEAVTHQENISRALFKDDSIPCINGHTGDFLRAPGQGRKCRQCKRESRASRKGC